MRYHFNDFILDTQSFEITKDGNILAAEPQVVELIVLLIKNRERLVTKEEIFQHIWKDRVVSEASLSSRVKNARQALDDDGIKQQVPQNLS